MIDKPRYWSESFVDVYVEALRTDPAFQRAARDFKGVIVLQCLDTPEGRDVRGTYRIDRGEVAVDVDFEPAPARALRETPFDKKGMFARTTAPYALWTKLDRGEMNVLQAIADPAYRVEGSKLRIVAHVGLFKAMNEVAARIDKTY